MFYSYDYFSHPLGQLHGAVRRFLWSLRRKQRPTQALPATFRPNDWCDGVLLMRAQQNQTFRNLLRRFFLLYKNLTRRERKQIYNAFRGMNRIEEQLRNVLPHRDINSLPASIREATKALFLNLYNEVLSPSVIRRKHYQCFCRRLERRHTVECPFCGLEDLFKEEDRLQDYDHLLGKARYPLAAVNPRNLAPMGMGCNQVFKQEKPLQFDDAGNRRRAFYQYREHGLSISLDLTGSRRPANRSDYGTWRIRLLPDRPEVRTWETVFELSDRIFKYRLKGLYQGWIDHFVLFVYQNPPGGAWNENGVRQAIARHAINWLGDPKIDHKLIRSAVFRFLEIQPDRAFFQNLADRMETMRNTAGLS